jgi:acyl-CoA thioester hydrolase
MSRTTPLTRDDFNFWTEIEVRWGDQDPMGHVNNARYFTYMETARVHFFEHLGLTSLMQEDRQGMSLLSINGTFFKEVHYPATLEVGTRVTRIGNTSFHLEQGFFLKGTDVHTTEGKAVMVWVDYERRKSAPVPDELRAGLERFYS